MRDKVQESGVQVFYDGDCPVCSKEISFYKSLRGADKIIWTDLRKRVDVPNSIDRESALRRIHAIDARGEVVVGAQVFSLIWTTLPRLRILGVVSGLPVVAWMMDRLYSVFLKFRPPPKTAHRSPPSKATG